MRLSRIYTDQPLAEDTTLVLSPAESHYAGTVLRLAPGASLVVFNGDGHEYPATVREAGARRVVLTTGQRHALERESPLLTHLGLGLSRGERMDYIVQKCTELGATTLTPLFTERCEVKLGRERTGKRLAHWRRIASSACEQCGRTRIPDIREPVALAHWVENAPGALRLIFHPGQGAPLDPGGAVSEVALLTGPEGGFSPAELTLAKSAGFTGISLGSRVLRAETAPTAALAILQYLWGDLKGEAGG